MVKLEFKTGEKPASDVDAAVAPTILPDEPKNGEEISSQHTPIMIGEVEFLTQPKAAVQPRTVDWAYIRRIAAVQVLLSFMAIVCITVIVFSAEMNRFIMWSKTALFSWALFLLCTGYAGYRSSCKNYCQLIAYFIMSIFQTMINGFWLALLFLAACYVIAYRDAYSFETTEWSFDIREFKVDWNTGILICELIESLCLFGTVFTGLLGAFAGCKGFGRILHHQDNLATANNVEAARY